MNCPKDSTTDSKDIKGYVVCFYLCHIHTSYVQNNQLDVRVWKIGTRIRYFIQTSKFMKVDDYDIQQI